MPIPGGLEPPSADQAPATMRYTARRLPFPLRLSISSTSPEIFEAPPRSHRDDRCFQHTRSRVDSAHTGRLSAVRGGAKVHARFIIETERARVSHHSACLSTPSQVHPSKRSETSCLSSCPAVSPYGAGRSEPRLLSRLANILHLSDSPTSPPSSPPKWSPRRGSNPHASGHIGQHRRADVLRLSRSGTVQLSHLPPAFHIHRVHSAERNAYSQRPRSTDAVLTGRRPTSPALTRDSHPLGTRICCARLCPFGRTLNPLPKKQGKSSVFLHGALCGARHQGVAPDRKKDKGYERDLRKRCAWLLQSFGILASTLTRAGAGDSGKATFRCTFR